VVVVVGLAITVVPVFVLSPVEGAHVKDAALPEAVRVALPPVQKEEEVGVTDTVTSCTVAVTVCVVVVPQLSVTVTE